MINEATDKTKVPLYQASYTLYKILKIINLNKIKIKIEILTFLNFYKKVSGVCLWLIYSN